MRRASTRLALLGLIVFGPCAVVSAEPTASITTFTAKTLPIPKYVHCQRRSHDAISVYAELSQRSVNVFVGDRGGGFDPAAVPAARRGVRKSILGRMQRAGGRASVRSSPREGTEVHMEIAPGRDA